MDYSLEEDSIKQFSERFLQSNTLLTCVFLLLVIKTFTIFFSINLPQNIFFADITKINLENSVNKTRQSLGLKPLAGNDKLNKAAMAKAQNMVQNQYFSHTSPTGVSPWFWFLQAGYNYKYAGENLAVGFYESEEVYEAWLNSPSHKANIVNPNYTEVGTAVLGGFGSNNTIIVVQEFGSQLPAKTVTKTQPKTPATVKPTTPTVTPEKAQVLSQVTESQVYIKPVLVEAVNNLPSKFLNFVIYDYDKILQNVAHGVSAIVIGILLLLIFLNSNISFKKELIFRSVLIIVLLSLATALNKDFIISLIPHQIII